METSVSGSMDRLVLRAREGSLSALDQLMASCRPWLRRRAGARLPRGLAHKQDGSDLVQECQSLASARFAQFRGRSLDDLRAWLAGILDRQLFRALRFWGEQRRDRRREQPLGTAEGARGGPAGASSSVVRRLARDEECQRLRLAASWCRPEDLAVIAMHLFEGRSHEEIAANLGVAPAAARQRYCRAVRRVGEALRLQELLSRRGIVGVRQDVIGLHRFQGASPDRIADRFRLPRELVARWIAEAEPWFRAVARDGP